MPSEYVQDIMVKCERGDEFTVRLIRSQDGSEYLTGIDEKYSVFVTCRGNTLELGGVYHSAWAALIDAFAFAGRKLVEGRPALWTCNFPLGASLMREDHVKMLLSSLILEVLLFPKS